MGRDRGRRSAGRAPSQAGVAPMPSCPPALLHYESSPVEREHVQLPFDCALLARASAAASAACAPLRPTFILFVRQGLLLLRGVVQWVRGGCCAVDPVVPEAGEDAAAMRHAALQRDAPLPAEPAGQAVLCRAQHSIPDCGTLHTAGLKGASQWQTLGSCVRARTTQAPRRSRRLRHNRGVLLPTNDCRPSDGLSTATQYPAASCVPPYALRRLE